jgi:hypothetical protein
VFWVSNCTNYLFGLVKLLKVVLSVKRFYFVVPVVNYEDFKKQPFVVKESCVTKRLSKLVFGVEQGALELKLE